MTDIEESMNYRFNYHAPQDTETAGKHQKVRELARFLANELCQIVPGDRELSLALARLEEVMFWSNAGIARGGWPEYSGKHRKIDA